MTPPEIAASLQLTEHGRQLRIEAEKREPPLRAEHRLAWAAGLPTAELRAEMMASVLRRCRSIVAVPANFGPLPSGARVVQLHALRAGGYTDAGGIATIQIPARHLEGTPRALALTIAGLLA